MGVQSSHQPRHLQERTPLGLIDAYAMQVVVSGGRGLGSGENFEMMYSLADKLNAAGEPLPQWNGTACNPLWGQWVLPGPLWMQDTHQMICRQLTQLLMAISD